MHKLEFEINVCLNFSFFFFKKEHVGGFVTTVHPSKNWKRIDILAFHLPLKLLYFEVLNEVFSLWNRHHFYYKWWCA